MTEDDPDREGRDRPERETEGDPREIRSLAVSAGDVANAFVYSRENPGDAVLRVTPPFHGRMRARLHVDHGPDGERDDGPIRVAPETLLADDVVADYPTLEAVENDLAPGDERPEGDGPNDEDGAEKRDRNGDHGDVPSPARLGEAHADALEAWRERAVESVVDSTVLETSAGTTRVDVKRLE